MQFLAKSMQRPHTGSSKHVSGTGPFNNFGVYKAPSGNKGFVAKGPSGDVSIVRPFGVIIGGRLMKKQASGHAKSISPGGLNHE